MEPNVGVNIKCNCFQWCPRKLVSSCCSKESDTSEDSVDERAAEVAKVALKEQSEQNKNSKSCCIIL